MSDDLEYGKYCAKCGQLMDCPPDLEPTPECNPCAQELLASLRSQLQQRDAELEVLRLELKAAEDGSGITNVQQQHEAQLAELHSQAIEWTHQRMEIVAQLAERDGRLLAMREALENAMCPHAAGCAHYVSGKPHMHRGVDCDAMHDCNCGLSVALDSTSSAAADARRRVVQEALREAADNLVTHTVSLDQIKGVQWAVFKIRARADYLDRPVAESEEGER